jgi:hypothetical protein
MIDEFRERHNQWEALLTGNIRTPSTNEENHAIGETDIKSTLLDVSEYIDATTNQEQESEVNGTMVSEKDDNPPFHLSTDVGMLGLRGRRCWSTGAIGISSNLLGKHDHLSRSLSSIMEPLLAIDEGSMEWRNFILQDLKERNEIVMSRQLMIMNEETFIHPLHKTEHMAERKLSVISEDDVSVLSGDSAPSNWSTTVNNNSQWKSSSKRSNVSSLRNSNNRYSFRHVSRRFIDLTINGGARSNSDDDDDDNEENRKSDVDDDDDHDDDDDDDEFIDANESSTMFAIPVSNIVREKKSVRSDARKFIDLTCEGQHDTPPKDVTNTSNRFLLSWIGKQDTSHTMDFQTSNSSLNVDVPNTSPSSTVETKIDRECAISVGSDDDGHNVILTPWEAADVAFIESVHDIARQLERTMNAQGLESPFWAAAEIFPQFQHFHVKLKENMERLKYQNSTSSTTDENNVASDTKSSIGKKVSRLTSKLSNELNNIARKHMLPQQDSMGGYDDLGMRALHRDDRAYLKTFLYEVRRDESCALPMVLARGLEKQLSDTTINVALRVIGDLTSPLRSCRRNHTHDEEEYHEDDMNVEVIYDTALTNEDDGK